VNVPLLALTPITCALPSPLLLRVPMPKISCPVSDASPPDVTAGSASSEPLLSVAKYGMGLATWNASASGIDVQPELVQP
jgi:hypothetical protein